MLGALKFIPRDKVEGNAEEKTHSKKRKHKDRDSGKDKLKSRDRRKRARSAESEGTGTSSDTSRDSDRDIEASTLEQKEDAKTRRKEAGLGWMLNAPDRPLGVPAPSEAASDNPSLDSEKPKAHARELNPDIATGGRAQQKVQKTTMPMIGDGGASWRQKALRRAEEQAAREGRMLDEIIEERWDSVETLTSSVAGRRSAHVNAHLHAIRDRKSNKDTDSAKNAANISEELQRGSSPGPSSDRRHDRHREHGSQMRVPHLDSNLSWKSKKKFENQSLRDADAATTRVAATTFNKYATDGSFLKGFNTNGQANSSRRLSHDRLSPEKHAERRLSHDRLSPEKHGERRPSHDRLSLEKHAEYRLSHDRLSPIKHAERSTSRTFDEVYESKRVIETGDKDLERSRVDELDPPQHKPATSPPSAAGGSIGLSANQIAAKAMRLRLTGKAREADELLKDFEASSKERPQKSTQHFTTTEQSRQVTSHGPGISSVQAQNKLRARNQSFDADMAETIAHNKSYKGNEDDEYDVYGNGLETERIHETKGNKKKLADKKGKPSGRDDFRQITTRQDQCLYCFENTQRPKHLVIAIANFTYLMLPPSTSFVPFHCYIVPMQHDGATRNVDEGVWQELRNFKKCLVQMFQDQGKEVLFLETAMGLARQRRHCFIECIPVPSNAAKDAPLYFKKAIDEVEDEWSQHDAKKLIDTRQKGLRNSIPKNFPYFHVEFGVQGGYCHVIDDESNFKPQFGRDVIAGILELPEEGRSKQNSVEQQRVKVKEFLKLWEPFDWTKMLD